MSARCIDGYDEIKLADDRRRIREIGDIGSEVKQRPVGQGIKRLVLAFTLLQTDKADVGHGPQGSECGKARQ